ncbi:hypothetical protein J8281_14800 [Aquimarina sp. U1-2]|uniref:hypothetical protein n=1 Tax=Aquimarina sp. U1-2 TaxID=2823141 RepID=UPI001AECFA56|nr:hypothetical protein [Aquimarina sp. U1-2]MBP2833462.1 hypothetical protein [Aquimarina sp. U1-2]
MSTLFSYNPKKMIKSCIVHKTNKNYKIITQSWTDIGLRLSTEPIFILPLDCKIEDLLESIFKSLAGTKENVIAPLEKEEYKKYVKKMISLLKEKSFDSLDKNSSSCNISQENERLVITPYTYTVKGGSTLIEEEKVEFNLVDHIKEEIVLKVIEILDKF